MAYYFYKTLGVGFDEAVTRVTQVLQEEGFGILTEIDEGNHQTGAAGNRRDNCTKN